MPNLVAHFGVGGVVTRGVIRDIHGLWIYAGCIIPDVPWILQRAVLTLPLEVNPYELRLYAISQASLTGCLLLAAALAALTCTPAKIFGVLAINSLVHLLLDALQTKWANGVHLFAPVSWQTWNAGLFWPESYVSVLLTAFGLGWFCADWFREQRAPVTPTFPPLYRIAIAVPLLAAYVLWPVLVQEGPRRSDSHFVQTLRNSQSRSGQYVELDRNRYIDGEEGGTVRTFAGEELRAIGTLPDRSGKLSIRGTFMDSSTIQIQAFHEHWTGLRDWASILGLILVAAWWSSSLCLSAFHSRAGQTARRAQCSPGEAGHGTARLPS